MYKKEVCMDVSISDSEWVILKILWDRSPLSADEIVQLIPASNSWKPSTTKTLINRLLQKKAISYEKEGRKYLYYPLVQKKDTLKKKNRNFLMTLYGGAVKNLFAAFMDDFDLSDEDISRIRTLLDQKEKELKNKSDE
jgi:BlaI family transcriptional regulator, penicillinase repressor